MPDIAVDGGEVVPRSIGESVHYRTIIPPLSRPLANFPIVAVRGETPIHRAQKIVSRIPQPMFPRPTPLKYLLMKFLPRIAR